MKQVNNEEKKVFEKYVKEIKRLLIEEKNCRQKLQRIHEDKAKYIELLSNGNFNETQKE